MLQTTRVLTPMALAACLSLIACGGGGTAFSTSGSAATAAAASTAAASANAYAISGVVTGSSTATLNLTGSATASTGLDSAGNYTFNSVVPGNYIVVPAQTGFLFSPVSRAELVSNASLTDVVFAATANTGPTYAISGTVSGSVIAGVQITLNGSNIGSTVTDLGGNYTFSGLIAGTYTVNAALAGYSVSTPLIVSVDDADSTADNFTDAAATSDAITFTPVAVLAPAAVGSAYSASVVQATTGGTAPYHYQSGALDAGTPPLGMIVNPNGDVTGTPRVVGVYDFDVCAVDSAGQTSACKPTSITVVAPTATQPTSPTTPTPAATESLGASPASITAGGSSMLTWSSTNATSCTASGGWAGSKATAGTLSISPASTTTYTLACAGAGGTSKTSVAVTVNPAIAAVAPTLTLSTNETTLTPGSPSTLVWSSKNAASCTASGGWTGSKAASGTLSVTPTVTTVYSLSCTNAGGSANASTKISVTAATPAPTVNLAASPTTVTAGQHTTLTWSSSNADSCTASNAWTGSQADSGTRSVSPAATSTYALSCSGAGGTTQVSAELTVNAAAVTSVPASGTSWVYYNGNFDWPGDYSFVASPNYSDTTGEPLSGTEDIKVTLEGAWGGWLPFAQNWNFNSKPYTKLTFALKPTVANQKWQVFFVKVGDVPVGISLDVANYGPAPVVGIWATYTIPLADLGVLGTSIYKFGIQDETGLPSNSWYVDNVGFVP